jgi:hypothetical protein
MKMPGHAFSRCERQIDHAHLSALRDDQTLLDLVPRIDKGLKWDGIRVFLLPTYNNNLTRT